LPRPWKWTLKSNENRVVILPEFVIDALAEATKGKGRDGLFWSTASGGCMGPPASKSPGYPARLRDAESPIDVSPSHGSRAAANPKVVQRLLGHATAAVTLNV
jgi:integrase